MLSTEDRTILSEVVDILEPFKKLIKWSEGRDLDFAEVLSSTYYLIDQLKVQPTRTDFSATTSSAADDFTQQTSKKRRNPAVVRGLRGKPTAAAPQYDTTTNYSRAMILHPGLRTRWIDRNLPTERAARIISQFRQFFETYYAQPPAARPTKPSQPPASTRHTFLTPHGFYDDPTESDTIGEISVYSGSNGELQSPETAMLSIAEPASSVQQPATSL
ncbi:hypothetical protein SAPIO_CDS1803 [Scedosporium apiospermum]|uniref:Uncharacterized protein n=1 Tax=Pseudallescheria apiosperma TaxID=563466 RepID=A0A084GDS3_PSEDA|nr:uncharacterized protein SAPIO_CDS1803 [Scedosporium apiospermum]KEZ45485.1 hypothetical protein SAPIO_CDS1803 [Scedosporium apiospermum]